MKKDPMVKKSVLLALLIWLATCPALFAQVDADRYGMRIFQAEGEIKLDGVLDEPAWQAAEVATQFFQNFPMDTSFAGTRTEAKVTYDEHFFYVGAICYDPEPGNYVIQSLKRDYEFEGTDGFEVYIDPYNDKVNGFAFGCSPLGVQREGLVEDGGGFGVADTWDNKWYLKVKQRGDAWVVEMAIPFKTLRFNENNPTWRINFVRNDLKHNETSSWVPIPRQFNPSTLAFTGQLHFETPPQKPGANVSVIPYVLGGYSGDFEGGQAEEKLRGNAGMDAKVAITPSLNLDLTINPDFSQVEVDRQVTNLQRFSIFFPERRQFFIENSDLFARFGFSKIRPFFSRRIGLYQGSPVPILGGARLSGKLNRNWRVGLLNMQTEGVGDLDLRAQNYTVAAFQRRVFNRSNIAGIFVNRQGFNGANQIDGSDYNRLLGFDYNIFSKNNRWRGKVFYHYTMDGKTTRHKGANAAWLMYETRNFTLMYNHEYVERNYNAEVGFVPRVGYFRLEPIAWFNFFPKKKGGPILSHNLRLYNSTYWDNTDWRLTDRVFNPSYTLTFRNRSEISLGVNDTYLYLFFPFDPTGTDRPPLQDSTDYRYQSLQLGYYSDFRKKLSYGATAFHGSYFGGYRSGVQGSLQYRAQPWGIFSLDLDYNRLEMPDTTVNLLLLSPRIELSFTKNLFFTTFFQYNTQQNNFNINARLQYRFAPMSDIFLVLTDNYDSRYLNVKNRSIVLKMNYWFTL